MKNIIIEICYIFELVDQCCDDKCQRSQYNIGQKIRDIVIGIFTPVSHHSPVIKRKFIRTIYPYRDSSSIPYAKMDGSNISLNIILLLADIVKSATDLSLR